MNKIEMDTIIDALNKKQTWVVKGFQEFTETWARQTESLNISDEIYITTIRIDNNHYDTFLIPGEKYLYFRPENDSYTNLDYFVINGQGIDNLTIDIIKQVTPEINRAIYNYFKNLQSSIDILSKCGQECYKLIDLLK